MQSSTNLKRVQVDVIEIVQTITKKENAMDVRSLLAKLDPLKLLVEYDEDYQSWVAHCVDTGAVATGKTIEEAESLILRILENDLLIAIRTNTLQSLFQTCASADVRLRWIEAVTTSPESVRTFELEIPSAEDGEQPKRGVKSELRIGKTKQSSAA